MFKKKRFFGLRIGGEREKMRRRREKWSLGFFSEHYFLMPKHRLTSHVLLAATSAGLMLGMAQWEAKATVGSWKSM